jgi:2-amino-4-hydroxy-6-hydroxymethyldihydropteridine diphosphokinase
VDVVYVALGANLPQGDGSTPQQVCARAVRAIAAIAGVSGLVQSRWYSSAPVPAADQPRYINGMVRLAATIAPDLLLRALQAIEQAEGRARSVPNAPRTLDLDIIDIGGLVRAAPDPVLPHPMAHQRAFVLLPLRDLAPFWIHPVLASSVQELIDALPPQDIRPM